MGWAATSVEMETKSELTRKREDNHIQTTPNEKRRIYSNSVASVWLGGHDSMAEDQTSSCKQVALLLHQRIMLSCKAAT
jgi:hypothetical protein